MVTLILAFTTIVLVWLFIVRPILKKQPVLSAAFKAEASFGDKVQAKIVGWRTRIAARLLAIGAILVGMYDQLLPLVLGQDWTPLTAKMPAWTLPLGMVGIAWLFSWLRNITDNPPRVVVQRVDSGPAQVVGLLKPV